ncbi:MAG: hypothetical protein FJ280_22075 [Planctomycetes bacterium]|nr:hypothetical protein [Planctomycetota bacterium]
MNSRDRKKHLIYNDDGWSSYMRYPAPMWPEDVVAATIGPVRGTAVSHYQFCSLGGHAVNYNSAFLPRVGEMMPAVDTLHVWRMRETLRHLDRLGTDPLRIVSEACRQHGIVCQFSLRMNDRHHTYKHADGSWYFPELLSPWLDEHPELLLPDRALDYAKPGVADYRRRQIREILDRYAVDGIDLDFTRFKLWFRRGEETAGAPLMTALVRELRTMTRRAGKTLSARFEYDPQSCLASGLEVEAWLADGLLDQVTLGGVGDHTPDAPADWWIERAHRAGCIVCPSMEGQLHWVPGCGGGGTGTHAGNGVHDGFGPPSLAYMRAVAANHYRSGADGISLFNFTCADGPFDRAAFTELADPEALAGKDKQYVVAVWLPDAQIYYQAKWQSRFALAPDAVEASYPLRIADDIEGDRQRGRAPAAVLTLDLKGVNRLSDLKVSINGAPLAWTGYQYNHYDHGCWNDIVRFTVPASCLRTGENRIGLRRCAPTPGFAGAVEVRKCVLDLAYPSGFAPGRVETESPLTGDKL